MTSRSPYSQYDETHRQRGRSPLSRRESSSTQTYTTKKSMKDDQEMARADRGVTRSNRDGSPDIEKSSDSYYSDDYENTTYGSDRSPTPSSKALSPRAKKAGYKVRSVTPVRNRGIKRVSTKFSSSKKAPRWGFRSQSLNKESPPKDIDIVTKRVLSARLLKINELRNELTELQLKLEECQKENKALKRLQFRQEKALNKFEDTENEVSQLISRHNNELRTLKERLRKSQERERNTEKRLKDTEEELYRSNVALKKLKQLSENKHLAEREELTKKVDLLESRLDDREKRVRELEKNIELTQSSFQRQLMAEKKRAHDVQENNKVLQEELQRLTQKLRDKERELDAKNIYALRLSKPSPKKDMEITPRRKGTSHSNNNIGFQKNNYSPKMDFPSPPPPPKVPTEDKLEIEQEAMGEDNLAKQLKEEAERIQREKEEAERLRRESEQAERKQAQEDLLNRNREQKLLEDKAKKLRDEWEKEEIERKRKEDLLNEEKNKKEVDINRNEEEKLKKELLLAKMFEIDRENRDPFYSDSSRPAPTPLVDTSIKMDPTDAKHKTYRFSEPTEKLFNGLPVHGGRDSKRDFQKNTVDTNGDFTFGSYTPSFGKGKSAVHSQRKDVMDESIITTSKLDIQKDKKSNLMEQLFGNGSNTTLPSISKFADQDGLTKNSRIPDPDSSNTLPWEQNSKMRGKDEFLSVDDKISSSSRSRVQNITGRSAVKAVNSVEDEIEELAL